MVSFPNLICKTARASFLSSICLWEESLELANSDMMPSRVLPFRPWIWSCWCFCCMLFVILLALRASSYCKYDMGVLSWLNMETLETACTCHFDGLVRCSLLQQYGTTVGLTVVYTNHTIMVIYFVHTTVYSIATLNPQLKKQVSVDKHGHVREYDAKLKGQSSTHSRFAWELYITHNKFQVRSCTSKKHDYMYLLCCAIIGYISSQ